MSKGHILIAGGGIAGLSAALALEQRGFAVTVLERSEFAQQAGAGIQLSPNATRLLDRLHVLPRLLDNAVRPSAIVLMAGKTAMPLLSLDLSEAEQHWGAPYLAVHRADLHAALLAEARTRAAIHIRIGCTLASINQTADGVSVAYQSASAHHTAAGVFLVAADGVRSSLRRTIVSADARFSGYIAYRHTFNARSVMPKVLHSLLASGSVAAFLTPNAHLVAYPLRNATELNLVAITRGSENGDAWHRAGKAAGIPAGFNDYEPDLATFLAGADNWSPYPIYVVRPNAKWSDGHRIMLIGDAAHGMAPYGAQGAAMAIEDACTLATCLDNDRTDCSGAIAQYEDRRRSRIRRIARRTAANRFAYHCSGPIAAARDLMFRLRGQSFLQGLDWIYAFDADA